MEPSRFDELTKALATSTSRRQALKTIAATTIGGLLGLGGIGTAFAKCKDIGHPCSKDTHCCTGYCDQSSHSCACPAGTTLLNGTCCPTANVCGSTCCDSSQICQGGICCLPQGAQVPGGCSAATVGQCCSHECNPVTNICVIT